MLVEKVEKEQSNNSSVEFKLQVSKDKIEKNLPQNSCKNIEEALSFVDYKINNKTPFNAYSIFYDEINSK